jgi:peptidoglycan/LPS O-acetylase OafA/YrhL
MVQVVKHDMRWLDGLKGFAVLWIVLDHIAEHEWGVPFAGNTFNVPLAQRIAQWAPLHNIFATLIRDVGWTGDQGVTLFLIISGLGLAYGMARRGALARIALGAFYRARAVRIYPLWWAAHLAILAVALILHQHLNPTTFVLSFLGIHGSYFPAWWFLSLILQCYLVFPLLWWAARCFGPMRMTLVCVGVGFAARAVGVFLFQNVGGGLFIAHPEFALGAGLGIGFADHRTPILAWLQASSQPVPFALTLLAAGFALSFTFTGMIVAPFLMGSSIFVLGYKALANRKEPMILTRMGVHSYVLCLAFDPVLAVAFRIPRILASWMS